MKRAASALWLLWGLMGCAHIAAMPAPLEVAVPGSVVTVTAESPKDRGELATLAKLASEALSALQPWGGLRAPTRLVIVPDHAALERRAGRPGFGWLRAWSQYDVVYVQSLGTWRFLFQPTDSEVRQLLTHELTHAAMYQAVSTAADWARVEVPLWFREGMASWTAREADKRYPVADLHRFATEHPDLDPLRQADQLVQSNAQLVYSAAHWAFDTLVTQGPERVRALLAAMRSGQAFGPAFEAAFGESRDAFEDRMLAGWRNRTHLGSLCVTPDRGRSRPSRMRGAPTPRCCSKASQGGAPSQAAGIGRLRREGSCSGCLSL